MIRLKTKLTNYLFSYDWEVVEIMGASFKTAWGIWLLLPFQTFKLIQGYNVWGSENFWGWGLLILGIIHFSAIYSNRLIIRRFITFIAFLFWIFTVVLIAMQSITAGLIPMFAIIAFFMGINFLRLGIDSKSENRAYLYNKGNTHESSINSLN